jgi:hypothetical protein
MPGAKATNQACRRRIRRRARRCDFFLVACLSLALLTLNASGCSRSAAPEDDAAAFEAVKTYEQGPLRVDLKVERTKISVADRVRVVLEATAPESQEVQLPERTEKVGEFAVAEFRTPQSRLLEDGRVLHRRLYVLEPFLAGSYKIPPFVVRGAQKQSPAAEPSEISTEEVAIEVASLLPDDKQQPQIKEIAEPVEIPAPWWPWVAAGLGAALVAGALIWWRRRRRAEQEAVHPPTPHEIAFRELEKLLASGLLEKGEAKLFYLRLSNVLRHYIEDRFGLRAPEQTTEEFLVELRRSQPFEPRHRELLQEFLEHCDLVKFAELQPSRREAETSVALCRRLIDETKHEEVTAAEPAGAQAGVAR